MDCPKYSISCRLDLILASMNDVTPVDWTTLLISAAAAIGTLWIACLNLRLLREQRDFEVKNVKAQYRLHRRRLATHLRQMSWDGLRGRIVESTAMIAKTSLRSDETTRLIDECNDERAARFVSLVELQVNMAAHEYFARKDRKDPIEALFAAHTELDEYLEEWVSDPDSVLSSLETQNRERERGRKAMHDFLGLE